MIVLKTTSVKLKIRIGQVHGIGFVDEIIIIHSSSRIQLQLFAVHHGSQQQQ
jgi:hypothetical protein